MRFEQDDLPRCHASVQGFFDEIVVLDTGSKDRTVETPGSFGARVFDFVWVDDFAAARHVALTRARGDYAFWLDADDLIEPPERAKLEALLGGLRGAQPHGGARKWGQAPASMTGASPQLLPRLSCDSLAIPRTPGHAKRRKPGWMRGPMMRT